MPIKRTPEEMREYQRQRRAKLREPAPVEKPEAPRKRRINDPVAEPHREEITADLPTMSEAIAGLSSSQQQEILLKMFPQTRERN